MGNVFNGTENKKPVGTTFNFLNGKNNKTETLISDEPFDEEKFELTTIPMIMKFANFL